MAQLMKARETYFAGEKLVKVDTVMPADDPHMIERYCSPYETDQPTEPALDELEALRVVAEQAGIKIDKRWGPDRLRDEIDAAGG